MSSGRLHPSSPGFLRLYGLAFLFFSANSVLTVMLPLLSSQEGFGEAEIGLMMGSYMLTCMLLRPLAGQLIGRHGPLAVMRWLLAAHAVSLALYAVAGAEQFTGLRIVQGAVTAFFSMTMQTGIVEGLEERDRAQGLSLYTLSTMVPSLIGPIVAVELWQNGDRLLLAAVLLALALLPLLLGLGAPLARRGAADRSYTLLDLGRSLRQVRGSRPLQASMAVMLCASFGFGATATFLPLSMMKDGSGHAGLYLMLQGAVVVACRFVLRKRIPSDGSWSGPLVSGLMLCAAAGFAMLALSGSLGGWVYVSALFGGLAMALLYPTLVTYLSFALPGPSKYVLMGLFLSSYDLGFSLGGLGMGWLVQASSYSTMYAACALISLVGCAAALRHGGARKRGAVGSAGERGAAGSAPERGVDGSAGSGASERGVAASAPERGADGSAGERGAAADAAASGDGHPPVR
ncbi:staphylopine family metallophore export MFS transporter CntE [Paenibacillus sp. B01]|uniref:staphylopine family metallophore export MFS transporter CntE n=1 Tax=Paenibacillus sp. B01 TaxID=2660554 RepID=UPI001E36A700|nr:MFS transporter [Paenibacillus sp. B01]